MSNDVAAKNDREVDLRKEAMHFALRMPSSGVTPASEYVDRAETVLKFLKGAA